jgi:hypothetical protein
VKSGAEAWVAIAPGGERRREGSRRRARRRRARDGEGGGVTFGSSEVERQTGGQLEVLRALVLAEQVEREDVVAQVELQRGVVGQEDAKAEAEVVGGLFWSTNLVLPTPPMMNSCDGRARLENRNTSPGRML